MQGIKLVVSKKRVRFFCNEKEFPLKIKESRNEKGATSSTLSGLHVQHSRDPKEDFP